MIPVLPNRALQTSEDREGAGRRQIDQDIEPLRHSDRKELAGNRLHGVAVGSPRRGR